MTQQNKSAYNLFNYAVYIELMFYDNVVTIALLLEALVWSLMRLGNRGFKPEASVMRIKHYGRLIY